jgi:hypothetical protein
MNVLPAIAAEQALPPDAAARPKIVAILTTRIGQSAFLIYHGGAGEAQGISPQAIIAVPPE